MTSRAGIVPPPVEASAQRSGRAGVAWGRTGLGLLVLGFAWLIPAFVDQRFAVAMFVWDAAVLAAWGVDLRRIPPASALVVERAWRHAPSLSVEAHVDLSVHNGGRLPIEARLVDAVPRQLRPEPPALTLAVAAGGRETAEYTVRPARRGEATLGVVSLRYGTSWRIAERWARAPIAQTVVTSPDLTDARQQSMFLLRSRQIEMEKRSARVRGLGRAFESLREHRTGDEFRDICWTATARRGKLVTRLYEIERSQTVWLLFDTGRLMRTRVGAISKLDHAINAGLALAEVALGSGDRVGVLAYGRQIAERLPPSRGSAHLGRIVDRLARIREDEWEADHVQAAGRLLGDQKRRSLIVWITDLAETAMTPEVIRAASHLLARHVVLFVAIGQPDLTAFAARRPETTADMYEIAAAQELALRRIALLARLRASGALTLETPAGELAPALVNRYLEVKQRGVL